MRRPYFADDLIDVILPTHIVTVPCERRDGGRLLLFARPRMVPADAETQDGDGDVAYSTKAWFVNDALASTLPVQCPSQQMAQWLADMWASEVHHGSVDAAIADQVERWCWWFTKAHPEQGLVFTPLAERPQVRPANTVQETPAGSPNVPGIRTDDVPAQTDIMPLISDNAPNQAQKTEESA